MDYALDLKNFHEGSHNKCIVSYYLEDVATEFDIQGLELDWIGACWDADFRREGDKWGLYDFKGTQWQTVNDQFRRAYLANAYRVLLTRAVRGWPFSFLRETTQIIRSEQGSTMRRISFLSLNMENI